MLAKGAMRALRQHLAERAAAALRLRAGVHCGGAVASEDDLIGHDVNVAARVTDAATGGQVLTTAHLRDEVGPLRSVAFGGPRSLRLKGLDDPVDVCSVRWS